MNTNSTSKRTPRGSLFNLPGSLPNTNLPDSTDHAAIAASFLPTLNSLTVDAFTEDALWRDSLALTGTMRTFFGASSIAAAWKETSVSHHPVGFTLIPHASRLARHGDHSWVDAGFVFETTGEQPQASCSGFMSLVPDDKGGWKIWVLRTILENLKGPGNVDMLEPKAEIGTEAVNGVDPQPDSSHFDCIVIGAGQAGLGTAGRLQALGVSYVLVDRYNRVGDSWNTRYDSMKLHTLREYAHLPFERTFGPEYPELLSKQVLATGYQKWVKKFDINIWTSTNILSTTWNEAKNLWTVQLQRDGQDKTLTARHLVFAIGFAQVPYMPSYPNQEAFQGTVMHSHFYKSPSQWKGKAGVVIGTGNTAHDVAEDMLNAGLSSVTMVQRGTTWVLPVENYQKAQNPFYNEHLPTALADKLNMSGPIAITRQIASTELHRMAREEPERFDSLERVGFKTERFGDLMHVLCERLGGHYMDVGASPKIAKGLIKIKSDAAPVRYTTSGLEFSDGTELPADVVIFSTGFHSNMRKAVGTFVGPEIENQLEDFWGLDAEGELLGAFKHSGHPGLWYAGGDLGFSRYFTRFLALQIKADILGTPLERYTKTPSATVANGGI